MKRILAFLIICSLILIFSLSSGVIANSNDLELDAKSALLMDACSGRILYAMNIDEPFPMASLTKIMTLVLALEAVEQGVVALDDLVSTSAYAASRGGTQVWLEVGEQLPLKEMLYAVAVGSANDAAVAVAEYLASSEAAFVQKMNQRAKELGLTNTRYINSNGLPISGTTSGEQYMTARDVAVLSRYAITVPLFMDFVSTYEYTMRAETTKKPQLWNFNKLLRRYAGVDGIKTGFTTEAGYCSSVTAKRDSLRLIAVVLGCSSEAKREADLTKLLDYGFRKYTDYLLYAEDSVVASLDIRKGDPGVVDVVVLEDFFVAIERGQESSITTEVVYPDNLRLPIVQGTSIGQINAYLDNQFIGSAPIGPSTTIEQASLLDLVSRISNNMINVLLGI